jgi:predicted PurR-regulated permease PerM
MASKIGIDLTVGSPSALMLVLVVLLVGALARMLERRYARTDGEMIRKCSPLLENDAVNAIESHVYRVIARYFVVGGLETAIGTGLALLALIAIGLLGPLSPSVVAIYAALVPVLGVAVALSALGEFRFFVWTGISTTVAIVVVFI